MGGYVLTTRGTLGKYIHVSFCSDNDFSLTKRSVSFGFIVIVPPSSSTVMFSLVLISLKRTKTVKTLILFVQSKQTAKSVCSDELFILLFSDA